MKTDPFRILPPHTAEEDRALLVSIEQDGLLNAVIVDTEGNIIDGHRRRDHCEKLGIDWLVGADVRVGLSDAEKKALAITINLARRSNSPTAAQRREYAEALLIANAASSDAVVGQVVGLSRATVQRLRTALAQMGKLKPVLTTVGKDGRTRSVSSEKRKSRFQVKSRREFARLAPVAHQLRSSPKLTNGIIRRPNRLVALLRREKALAQVEASKTKPLPATIDIRQSDFRKLEIKPRSVDLICTDVVWGEKFQKDWGDLAKLAKGWLKPNGLFATFIGSDQLFALGKAVEPHLNYSGLTFVSMFEGLALNRRFMIAEGCRMIPVFSPSQRCNFHSISNVIKCGGQENDYDDWQQPLGVVKEIIRRLVPRTGSPLVLDPQLGTGTSGVACSQLGLRFIGCDIDPEKIKIARFRVGKEGKAKRLA